MPLSTCTWCSGSGRNLHFTSLVSPYCNLHTTSSCEACSQVSRIEHKIPEARRMLDKLLLEREAMASTWNKYHDRLVRHLPTEVVTEVFRYCLPKINRAKICNNYDQVYCDSSTKLLGNLVKIGQVCQQWRNIVRGEPRLWSFIPIKGRLRSFDVLQNWFELSSGLPFSFEFTDPAYLNNDKLRGLVTAMQPYGGRLSTLVLREGANMFPNFSESFKNIHFPNLQHIEIYAREHTFTTLEINAAPKTLKLDAKFVDVQVNHWDNLSCLHVNGLPISTTLEIIRNASNLACCKASSLFHSSSSVALSRVVSPSLISLYTYNVASEFWRYITLPHLLELSAISNGISFWNSLCDFLMGSSRPFKLESVSIADYDEFLTCNELISILEHIPGVKKLDLHIERRETSYEFIHRAIRLSDQTNEMLFLSNLEILMYNTPDVRSGNEEILVPFLRSICGRSQHLRSISMEISGREKIDTNIQNELKDAANAIELSICDGRGEDLLK